MAPDECIGFQYAYIKMATVPRILLFLVCAFHLQNIHSNRTDFHYIEQSRSSSSSESKNENFKKEISLVNNKANAVMLGVCDFMRDLNQQCSIGAMDRAFDRRFFGRYALNFAGRIYDFHVRMLYTAVQLCQKLLRCINISLIHIRRGSIERLPPCTQRRFRVIQNWFRSTLKLMSRILKLVYGYGRQVAKCALSLDQCRRTVFDRVFQTITNIIRNIVGKATDAVATVLRLSKTCPQPEIGYDPKVLGVELGKCFFCAFRTEPGGICH